MDEDIKTRPFITEDSLALQFAERWGSQFRYVPDLTGRNKWVRNIGGTNYEIDTTFVVLNWIKHACRAASLQSTDPAEARWLASAHTVWSVEWLCRSAMVATLEEVGMKTRKKAKTEPQSKPLPAEQDNQIDS